MNLERFGCLGPKHHDNFGRTLICKRGIDFFLNIFETVQFPKILKNFKILTMVRTHDLILDHGVEHSFKIESEFFEHSSFREPFGHG
ncbi:MAG TPA: hypothetical protein DCL41_08770 [Bdellovibrionales bacterium]|nr:hypothetical protein [Bdellovibrionales bacterium]